MKRKIKLPPIAISLEGDQIASMPVMPRLTWGKEEGQMQKLLSTLGNSFDMDMFAGDQDGIESDGVLRTARQGGRMIEVFEQSGSFRYSAEERQIDGLVEKVSPPADPVAAADAFLAARGLLGPEVSVARVSTTQMTAPSQDGEMIGQAVETHVHYRFTWGGIPVIGPGAKMRVTFGPDGQVSSMYRFWRVPGRADAAQPEPPLAPKLLTARDLRRRLAHDPLWSRIPRGARVRIKRVYLAYYAAPPSVPQAMLVPVFACEGSVRVRHSQRHDFVRLVRAVRMRAEPWSRTPAIARALIRR